MNEDAVNKQWFSQLPVNRKIFIGKFIEKKTIQNDNLVAAIMDKCIMGAIDDNIDIDTTLMKKIIKESNDYIADYKEYLDKNGEDGFNMIDNTKVSKEIKGIMARDINEGLSKVKCMAKLKKLYSLPAAELSDLWVACNAELDKEKKKPESTHKENNLQVVKVTKEINGKFGLYKKSNDGVELDNGTKYSNKEEVIKEKEERALTYDKSIEELKKKIKDYEEDKNSYVEKYEELEQVFSM